MGKTIIEKLEELTELPGYVFVFLTPDDIGGKNTKNMTTTDLKNPDLKLQDLGTDLKCRARQNVVLELGYFIGMLGRNRVCCILTGEVEIPSDVSGVLYKKFKNSVSELYGEIRKELTAAGYQV